MMTQRSLIFNDFFAFFLADFRPYGRSRLFCASDRSQRWNENQTTVVGHGRTREVQVKKTFSEIFWNFLKEKQTKNKPKNPFYVQVLKKHPFQIHNKVVLPKQRGCPARLRRVQPSEFRAHTSLDDGGTSSHRAPSAGVLPGGLQARPGDQRRGETRSVARGSPSLRRPVRGAPRRDLSQNRAQRRGGLQDRHPGGLQPDTKWRVQSRGRVGRNQDRVRETQWSGL